MDRNTFLEKLKDESSKHKAVNNGKTWWYFYSTGFIRSGCEQCPLTFLAKQEGMDLPSMGPDEWEEAAEYLGMDRDEAASIVHASDDHAGCEIDLRKKLIEACDLMEVH